jgi:hypothetical protein
VSPCLKGMGPFIAGRRLYNYKLIYFYIHNGIYMNSGSRLEMVASPRSVGGFHGVRAYYGVFQTLSLCSPGLPGSEVNDAQDGSWRGCFVMSCLGSDFFPCGMMRWMG